MKPVNISRQEACHLIIKAQLLDGLSDLPEEKESLVKIFDRLGYIQIDTINVIERAHHHTSWVRLPGYERYLIHDLQATDRRIFEYWGHAMSYIPISDYRYFLPKMKRFENPSHPWVRNMYKNGKHLLQPVLDRIRAEGPLSSKDFKRPDNKKGGAWWDWKPAKFALEYLFWRGDLMISERRNFQKVYDLTERVLPEGIDLTVPDEAETARYLVLRALKANGVMSEREISKFMQPGTSRDSDFQAAGRDVINNAIMELVEEKKITKVKIEGQKNNTDFALAEILNDVTDLNTRDRRIHFLSPFDNLIIQRERIKRLFDFDYALECYVPAVKRKYGYFVLPVLYGNRFIGRIDPKADRKNKKMILNSITFEDGFEPSDIFIVNFAKKMTDFAHFNKCRMIEIKKVQPGKMKPVLKSAIKKQQV